MWVRVFDPDGPSKARRLFPPSQHAFTSSGSRNKGQRSLRSHHQRATFRKAAHRIEPNTKFLFSANAPGIVGWSEVEDEILSNDKDSLCRNGLQQDPLR